MGGLRNGAGAKHAWVTSRAGRLRPQMPVPIFYQDEDGDSQQQAQAHLTLLSHLPLCQVLSVQRRSPHQVDATPSAECDTA